MTSSTPDSPGFEVLAAGARVPEGAVVEVVGRGDLVVRSWGHAAGGALSLRVGEREVALVADADGVARWVGPGLLAEVAGDVVVRVEERQVVFRVRPEKLVAEAVLALVEDLEGVAAGLAFSAGSLSGLEGARSRDRDLATIDVAVGLAASAAPGIRRRPIHRSRDVVRAVPSDQGPRSARDVRWLATHPVQAVRAEAQGRAVAVHRERRSDLDTLENRGVLAAYDRIDAAVGGLRAVVEREVAQVAASRPAREAFLTERGSLWSEKDAPRVRALERRRERLDELGREVASARSRSGLPDLRPRGPRMARTPRVDAEPAYWTTFRAYQLAEGTAAEPPVPTLAPVRALDALWEQWCAVTVARALAEVLGPPDAASLVDVGWFSTLRMGEVASWTSPRRTVRLQFEPEIGATGEPRKLVPGRPWRPDLVIEVRWADGTLDLHVFDAKFRWDGWAALQEVWLKYGDSIGDAAGWPVVRSVWTLWPGSRVRLMGPRMLDPGWPAERLRGGAIGLEVGGDERRVVLADVLSFLLPRLAS